MNTWRLIQFPTVSDPRGNLSFAEGIRHVPFEIKRVFYMYNIPVDCDRGGHAHKELEQLVIPLYGGFNITVENAKGKETFILDNPGVGLYIPPLTWNTLTNFAPSSVCLVLASDVYKESDYYRVYEDFKSDTMER